MDERTDTSRMTREIYQIPEDVMAALEGSGLLDSYHLRPGYQQNDYVGWIGRAKQAQTRAKRIAQMLAELRAGNVYMKMAWPGSG